MKSPKRWRGTSQASIASENPFEELRDLFFARLQSDRVRLTVFAAALARTEGDPACTFEGIQLFAHRLRGGAAIFETPEIGIAAYALEQAAAAAAAAAACADNLDAPVWLALESLLDRLAIVNGQRGPPALATTVS
jgi:hypothetical protein